MKNNIIPCKRKQTKTKKLTNGQAVPPVDTA